MTMKPVLFSVSYAGLWGQHRVDLPTFIAKAAAFGYPAIQLMGKTPHLSPWRVTDAELERIKACAAEHKVEIATIAAYTDFTNGKAAPEVPFRDMQFAYVRALSKIASQLGAKILRVFTGHATAENAYLEDWEKTVSAIRECSTIAQDYGIILGVQNHHDVANGCDAYIEFLNEVNHPNCRAMFDAWLPALNGEDLEKFARILAPRMVQTTLGDYVNLKRFAYTPGLNNYRVMPGMLRAVPMGEGFVDYTAFFKGLKQGGFDGYISYGLCTPLRGGGGEENLDKTVKAALVKIKQFI